MKSVKNLAMIIVLPLIPIALIGESFDVEYTSKNNPYHEMNGFLPSSDKNKNISNDKPTILPMPLLEIDANVSLDFNESGKTVPVPIIEEKTRTLEHNKSHPDSNTTKDTHHAKSQYEDIMDRSSPNGDRTKKSSIQTTHQISRSSSGELPIAGKLLFIRNGTPMSCSASLIERSDLLLTAAHCICRNSPIHTNFAYYPSPSTSKEFYQASRVHKPSEWKCNDEYSYDFAFIKLNKKVEGSPMILKVGSIPPNKKDSVTAYGYQQGEWIMRKVSGSYVYDPFYLYMSNTLKGGSSGGPWVKGNVVLGLNSAHPTNNYKLMASPYFMKSFQDILREAKR